MLDRQVLLDQPIDTDRLRFWRYFQRECLQPLGDILSSGLLNEGGTERGTKLPLFYSMDVVVEMSEQEEKLFIDEEVVSSLEALHEDIYFYTFDFFADLGERVAEVSWTSPGAIRPFIKVKEGASPRASISVREYIPSDLAALRTKSLIFNSQGGLPMEALIEAEQGGEVRVSSVMLQRSEPPATPFGKVERLTANDWNALENHPSIHIWEIARSFEGRPIHAVELTAPQVADYRSSHKLALYKPTVIIETGHHANEVSSMPAIRELAEEILDQYAGWLDRINIVVIPCANPDGKALHDALIEDHPEWKHHAARFNAVGLEFAHHRFQSTLFGEATAVPKLFERWLPDIMIDDHGIPSHEWTQPFAGYNSPPRFPVSYWIPISLIYGIARELDREEYPGHAKALDAVVSEINSEVKGDPNIWDKNNRYRSRYIRYGHQYEPEAFPLEGEGEMIFYRWPTKVNPKSTALLSRYPEWCTLDIISEAADETVRGEALEDCIQSHKLFDRAIIRWLAAQQRQQVLRETQNGWIRMSRKRPLQTI